MQGRFHTEDIYLRLDGAQVTYSGAAFLRQNDYELSRRPGDGPPWGQRRLLRRAIRSAELNGKDTWQTVTLLDVAAMERQRLHL